MFMRSPGPLPGGRRRVFLLTAVSLFALYLVASTAAGVWTDYLWFDSVGYTAVWWSRLWTRIGLLLLGVGLAFFFIFANLALVDRMSLRYLTPPTDEQEEFMLRLREWVEPRLRFLRLLGAAFLAIMVGGSAATWVDRLYLFVNPFNFGVFDPIFDNDVGFYVFQLPFINDVLVWAFNLFLVTALVVAGAHYVNGALRFRRRGAFFTGGAKIHLSLLLAGLAVLRAALYQIDGFRLLYSDRAGDFFGPGFTEVTARLPALRLLLFVSLLTAVAFIVNLWRQGWTLPLVAGAAWLLVAVGAGLIYPEAVERIQVIPNTLERQREYINNNIQFTRRAYGLDRITVQPFQADATIEPSEIEDYELALSNLRLWDATVLGRSYAPQEFRAYFKLERVDTDRYVIDGAPAQVMVAVRELDAETDTVQQNWQNRRLSYTHGFGVVASHAARTGPDGQPAYLVSGMPPEASAPGLELTQPRIYFGEIEFSNAEVREEPVIVNNAIGEIDFPSGQETTSHYEGSGGVELSSIWRRAAMALRYRDINMFLSDQILPDSRILMERNVRDMVGRLAPFLAVDSDPYPVVLEGGVVWVIDLYTTSRNYPLSTPLLEGELRRLALSSGIEPGSNYIRNSAKAVIDAYDGSVTIYAMDESDPVLQSWIASFPTLIRPSHELPEGLRSHVRYPMDLFTVQTNIYRQYHVTDPAAFLQGSDEWSIPNRPTEAEDSPGRSQLLYGESISPATNTITYIEDVLPYYLLMPLENELTYVGLQSFTLGGRPNLSAFLVVDSNPANYGALTEFRMPSGSTVAGIAQVQARIEADPEIAAQFTLWRNRGSRALQGDIMIVPIGDSLLYVQPVFLEAEAGGIPAFERVIVAYGERIEWGPNLASTLDLIFGTGGGDGEPPPPTGEDAAELLQQASELFNLADQALADRDLATYQRLIEQARGLVEQARELLNGVEAARRARLG
ncbi:MAG TPA: UPF0182 family protein [Acidimicrobiia bacterium]|nr:UPF0182 family protein [Acidimicrobiia bacterium]